MPVNAERVIKKTILGLITQILAISEEYIMLAWSLDCQSEHKLKAIIGRDGIVGSASNALLVGQASVVTLSPPPMMEGWFAMCLCKELQPAIKHNPQRFLVI